MADPPITPPTDMSVIPVVSTDDSSPQPVIIPPQPALHTLQLAVLKQTKEKSAAYAKLVWHWQTLMGLRRTHFSPLAAKTKSLAYAKWVLKGRQNLSHRLHAKARLYMADQIQSYRETTRHWSLVMGVSTTYLINDSLDRLDQPRRSLASASANIEEQFNRWHVVEQAVLAEASNPPYSAQFECIHGYEGAWTANTGNGFYGGLQMDRDFQRTYGSYLYSTKGTANNWTPEEQKWVASKAVPSRGFHPWPNTAHSCGYI